MSELSHEAFAALDVDFYDACNTDELTHQEVFDAIDEVLRFRCEPELFEPVEVVAYKRAALTPAWFDADDADSMIEDLEGHSLEVHASPDDGQVWRGPVREELKARLVALFQEFTSQATSWHCEEVARRTYSADELRAMFPGEQPGKLIGGE